MKDITFEKLIERLKQDDIEHGAITREYCSVYGVLADKWQKLLDCHCRLDICNKTFDFKEHTVIWNTISEILDFLNGMLYGLEAGRLITSAERYVLADILHETVFPPLDKD